MIEFIFIAITIVLMLKLMYEIHELKQNEVQKNIIMKHLASSILQMYENTDSFEIRIKKLESHNPPSNMANSIGDILEQTQRDSSNKKEH